jgi:hypothetical protein
MRFRLPVEPKQTAVLTVEEARPIETTFAIGKITSEQVALLVRENATKIFDDQQRLRENIKALNGSAEEKALLQRYTQQLNEQETRLAELRKETEKLAAQSEYAEEVLDEMIRGLSFDVKL